MHHLDTDLATEVTARFGRQQHLQLNTSPRRQKMRAHWHPLLLLQLISWASLSTADNSPAFENTIVTRTIELGGSSSHVTTSYSIRSLEEGTSTYWFALGGDEVYQTSWIEANIKGRSEKLEVQRRSVHSDE